MSRAGGHLAPGRRMSVGDFFGSEEIGAKSMSEEHDGESIIPYHRRSIIVREVIIFLESECFVERCCFREIDDREIHIEACHKKKNKEIDIRSIMIFHRKK